MEDPIASTLWLEKGNCDAEHPEIQGLPAESVA